jgi:hypothetical protein
MFALKRRGHISEAGREIQRGHVFNTKCSIQRADHTSTCITLTRSQENISSTAVDATSNVLTLKTDYSTTSNSTHQTITHQPTTHSPPTFHFYNTPKKRPCRLLENHRSPQPKRQNHRNHRRWTRHRPSNQQSHSPTRRQHRRPRRPPRTRSRIPLNRQLPRRANLLRARRRDSPILARNRLLKNPPRSRLERNPRLRNRSRNHSRTALRRPYLGRVSTDARRQRPRHLLGGQTRRRRHESPRSGRQYRPDRFHRCAERYGSVAESEYVQHEQGSC